MLSEDELFFFVFDFCRNSRKLLSKDDEMLFLCSTFIRELNNDQVDNIDRLIFRHVELNLWLSLQRTVIAEISGYFPTTSNDE